jgi:hypothetical protein
MMISDTLLAISHRSLGYTTQHNTTTSYSKESLCYIINAIKRGQGGGNEMEKGDSKDLKEHGKQSGLRKGLQCSPQVTPTDEAYSLR